MSLFAEMFGFPLTVYFVSSAFGRTLFEREFMLYMHRVGMPLGSLVTFLGVVLVVFGWGEVYRAGIGWPLKEFTPIYATRNTLVSY